MEWKGSPGDSVTIPSTQQVQSQVSCKLQYYIFLIIAQIMQLNNYLLTQTPFW